MSCRKGSKKSTPNMGTSFRYEIKGKILSILWSNWNTNGLKLKGSFIDTYYNNTLKTMMGLRWAAEACPKVWKNEHSNAWCRGTFKRKALIEFFPKARFYAFIDDDYYVSTRNILRFLRNPVNYPRYLEDPVIRWKCFLASTCLSNSLNNY